jgi:hypothetical protein
MLSRSKYFRSKYFKVGKSFFDSTSGFLRLDAELTLEGVDAELILAQRRRTPAVTGMEAHERAMRRFLSRACHADGFVAGASGHTRVTAATEDWPAPRWILPVHSIEQERPPCTPLLRGWQRAQDRARVVDHDEAAALPARRLLRRSRDLWWKLPPLPSPGALKDVGHKLGPAPDPEMAIEGSHVLMGRVVA